MQLDEFLLVVEFHDVQPPLRQFQFFDQLLLDADFRRQLSQFGAVQSVFIGLIAFVIVAASAAVAFSIFQRWTGCSPFRRHLLCRC